MNEPEFGHKIAERLDQGLGEIPAATLARLASARAAALTRGSSQSVIAISNASSTLAGSLGRFFGTRVLGPSFALVLLALAVLWWQQAHRLQHNNGENAEVDAAVLTDELPVTAYLDQGFEIWLYHETPAAERTEHK